MHNLLRSGGKTLAAVAGVFLGAYVLHLADGSKWTEALASVATVAATGVALFIATRDRHERRADRLDADRAQARLVLLEVDGPYRGAEDRPPHFIVHIEANGVQPILDVALESATYVVDDSRSVELITQSGGMVPIVKPERAPGGLPVWLPSTGDVAEELSAAGGDDAHGNYVNPSIHCGNVAAVVQFTDASGNRWRRSRQGAVELVTRASQ